MPRATSEAEALRVVAHFDLDCFYVQVGTSAPVMSQPKVFLTHVKFTEFPPVNTPLPYQVEQRRRPELRGRPTAVVQFNVVTSPSHNI